MSFIAPSTSRSKANSFVFHVGWPTVGKKILATMQKHDPRAGEIRARCSRQRQRGLQTSSMRIRIRQRLNEPALEHGGLAQPKPAKEDMARGKTMINRTPRGIKRSGDCADRCGGRPARRDETSCRVENFHLGKS